MNTTFNIPMVLPDPNNPPWYHLPIVIPAEVQALAAKSVVSAVSVLTAPRWGNPAVTAGNLCWRKFFLNDASTTDLLTTQNDDREYFFRGNCFKIRKIMLVCESSRRHVQHDDVGWFCEIISSALGFLRFFFTTFLFFYTASTSFYFSTQSFLKKKHFTFKINFICKMVSFCYISNAVESGVFSNYDTKKNFQEFYIKNSKGIKNKSNFCWIKM